jgi:light-regulated signal transduction histidine kinase (bacteriophytochrome)
MMWFDHFLAQGMRHCMTNMIINDLTAVCEREAIHTPGAIQPFGMLIAIDMVTLKVLNASANCALAFGIAAEQLLAQSLTSYLSDDDVKLLRQRLLQPALQEAAPLSLCIGTPGTAPNAGPYTQTQQAIAASWSLNMMPIPQL